MGATPGGFGCGRRPCALTIGFGSIPGRLIREPPTGGCPGTEVPPDAGGALTVGGGLWGLFTALDNVVAPAGVIRRQPQMNAAAGLSVTVL